MKVERHCLFPSTIRSLECDGYDKIKSELVTWILNYRNNNPTSEKLTNRGGWQSSSTFYHDESFSLFFEYILKHIHAGLSDFKVNFTLNNMWININERGNYNALHNHPHSHISGVFWVKTPDNCGDIAFENPHHFDRYIEIRNLNQEIAEETKNYFGYTFFAKEGSILLFPSDIRHEVQQNNSDEERISISFNMTYF